MAWFALRGLLMLTVVFVIVVICFGFVLWVFGLVVAGRGLISGLRCLVIIVFAFDVRLVSDSG